MTETRRIHFIPDFEEDASSHSPKLYTCRRCGEDMIGRVACYEHRHGLLSECRVNRLMDWYDRNIHRRS